MLKDADEDDIDETPTKKTKPTPKKGDKEDSAVKDESGDQGGGTFLLSKLCASHRHEYLGDQKHDLDQTSANSRSEVCTHLMTKSPRNGLHGFHRNQPTVDIDLSLMKTCRNSLLVLPHWRRRGVIWDSTPIHQSNILSPHLHAYLCRTEQPH